MAELRNWRPIRDTHAIQTAQLQVQFGEPAGDVLWRRVQSSITELGSGMGLGERQPVSNFPFQIQIMGPGAVVGQDADQGFVLTSRSDSGEVVEQFTATRDALKYEQSQYTRWAPFRERAQKLMSSSVDQYGSVSSLGSITSNYVDVFEFSGTDNPDVSEVIAFDGPFVARASQHPSTLWHTHSGFFEYPSPETRRLVIVNVDIQHTQVSGRPHFVRVTTQISDQFSQPELQELDPAVVSWDFIAARADEQHLRLKSLLGQVLTSDAAQAISLA